MAATLNTYRLLLYVFFTFAICTKLISALGTRYVTMGSVIKLLNIDYNVRLHSHDIKYGSGSGQQSVTGTEDKVDANSYWLVKAKIGKELERGRPFKCGEIVRLEHVPTKKNLHSHHVSSPLSGKQEISAFGDSLGNGDTGDHWLVLCDTDFWERHDPVRFKHVDTDGYLTVTGRSYGSPLVGQMEVAADYTPNSHDTWKAMEGIFVHPQELSKHYEHTEL